MVATSMAFPFQGLTDMKKIHGTNLDNEENCQSVMECSFSEEEQLEQENNFSAEIARIIESLGSKATAIKKRLL